jgi:hypothetical protein
MSKLPTIWIVNPRNPDPQHKLRINLSDFDPNLHTPYEEKVLRQQKEEATQGQQVAEYDQADLEVIEPEITDAREYREIELMGIYEQDGWRGLRAIAKPLGIEKPDDGWDEAIPLILEAEGYGSND